MNKHSSVPIEKWYVAPSSGGLELLAHFAQFSMFSQFRLHATYSKMVWQGMLNIKELPNWSSLLHVTGEGGMVQTQSVSLLFDMFDMAPLVQSNSQLYFATSARFSYQIRSATVTTNLTCHVPQAIKK